MMNVKVSLWSCLTVAYVNKNLKPKYIPKVFTNVRTSTGCQIYTDSSFLKLLIDTVVTSKLETKFIENFHKFIGSILNIIFEETMFVGHCVP